MKENTKDMDKLAGKKNEEAPLQKDYAHYPPAPTEQVKPHAHKQDDDHNGDKNANEKIVVQQPAKTTSGGAGDKTVNNSNKIVNSVDESYSDGSGGGFEATEQVND